MPNWNWIHATKPFEINNQWEIYPKIVQETMDEIDKIRQEREALWDISKCFLLMPIVAITMFSAFSRI